MPAPQRQTRKEVNSWNLREYDSDMSAVPRHPSDLGYAGLLMTADEYLALGETPERYELINGVVVMSPSPTPWHQHIVVELVGELYVLRKRLPGLMIFSDTDLRLGASKVYRPDVCAYRPGRLASVPPRLDTPPDLVVEVLSPGSPPLDLITKRDDYEKFGVGEYWVIDPADGKVRCWVREVSQFLERPVGSDALPSTALPGFELPLAAIRPRS